MKKFAPLVVVANLLVATLVTTAPASAVVVNCNVTEYPNYATLAQCETEGVDYRRVQVVPAGIQPRVAHIAIHGGAIEAPTTQLARHAAVDRVVPPADRRSFYSLEGIKPSGNAKLHITSTQFDEPNGLAVVQASRFTVSWHGASGTTATTYVGGRDAVTAARVRSELTAAGFHVTHPVPPNLDGSSPNNIVNRNLRGMGVQLEITRAQREQFFAGGTLTRSWVENPANRTQAFYDYVAAVNRALS
ncbi:poly-gamma-glutamate hydrolase family protein [Rhizohabitans arisaemae]|uniref:poly-gamma-glutamate hydrolase family protein n=1 Tax=Rhizohabitans arisaemae TaxID=2720610 RepID=UPI0024B067F1|nr:poly-gamma-glutamate hydrolase family protein [Rhizohabitans arisaemae]